MAKSLSKPQICARLDRLVEKMNGRELECKSWYETDDNIFKPHEVRATFDFIINQNCGERNAIDVMKWANDLWREANK